MGGSLRQKRGDSHQDSHRHAKGESPKVKEPNKMQKAHTNGGF